MTAIESRSEAVSDAEFTELMAPLVKKIATEMRKERGAEYIAESLLYALACRAAVAAGAYIGDPRSTLRSVPERVCPGCGSEVRCRGAGCSCVHTAGCGWRENGP